MTNGSGSSIPSYLPIASPTSYFAQPTVRRRPEAGLDEAMEAADEVMDLETEDHGSVHILYTAIRKPL
jgi:hypothetical protein